jgi:hypothetical protein
MRFRDDPGSRKLVPSCLPLKHVPASFFLCAAWTPEAKKVSMKRAPSRLGMMMITRRRMRVESGPGARPWAQLCHFHRLRHLTRRMLGSGWACLQHGELTDRTGGAGQSKTGANPQSKECPVPRLGRLVPQAGVSRSDVAICVLAICVRKVEGLVGFVPRAMDLPL